MRVNKAFALFVGLVAMHCVSVASAASFNLANLCTLKIYLSGASAQDNSLDSQVQALMVDGDVPGKTGTPIANGTVFDGAQDDSWRVIIGELDPAKVTGGDGSSVDTGTVGCFFKRSEGGSAWGVQPVSQGDGGGIAGRSLGLPVVHMTAVDCDDVTNTCQQTGDGNMASIVPDVGLSDVEPAQFIGVNTPGPQVDAGDGYTDSLGNPVVDPNPAAMSAADISALEVFQQSIFAFGTVVNPEFYAALQLCQGIISNIADADYDDLAMMPSLTKAQVVSMFQGRLQTLKGIPCTSGGGDNLWEVATAAGTAPAFDGHENCVRADGSGTKAQFRIKNFGVGCLASGAIDFQDPLDIFANNITTIVSGSSDMGRCVSGNTDDAATVIGQRWKIGFQATDKTDNMTAGATDFPQDGTGAYDPNESNTSRGYYRFIKVDGQAPTLANTWKGGWYDAVNATLQLRAGGVSDREYYADVVDGVTGAAQDVENILQTLIANFAVPADVGAANADLVMPGSGDAWYGGSLVINGAGCDVNSGGGFSATGNPCAIVTHLDNQLNNCRTPSYTNTDLDYNPNP